MSFRNDERLEGVGSPQFLQIRRQKILVFFCTGWFLFIRAISNFRYGVEQCVSTSIRLIKALCRCWNFDLREVRSFFKMSACILFVWHGNTALTKATIEFPLIYLLIGHFLNCSTAISRTAMIRMLTDFVQPVWLRNCAVALWIVVLVAVLL